MVFDYLSLGLEVAVVQLALDLTNFLKLAGLAVKVFPHNNRRPVQANPVGLN